MPKFGESEFVALKIEEILNDLLDSGIENIRPIISAIDILQLIKEVILLARAYFNTTEGLRVFGYRNPDMVVGQSTSSGKATDELVESNVIPTKDHLFYLGNEVMVPYLDIIYSDIKDLEGVIKLPAKQQKADAELIKNLILSRGWSMNPADDRIRGEVENSILDDTGIPVTSGPNATRRSARVNPAAARSNSLSQVETIVHYRIRRFLRRQKHSAGKTSKHKSVKGRHTDMKSVRPNTSNSKRQTTKK
jgi:hypothetical protein